MDGRVSSGARVRKRGGGGLAGQIFNQKKKWKRRNRNLWVVIGVRGILHVYADDLSFRIVDVAVCVAG